MDNPMKILAETEEKERQDVQTIKVGLESITTMLEAELEDDISLYQHFQGIADGMKQTIEHRRRVIEILKGTVTP
jgi:hypothetical protein